MTDFKPLRDALEAGPTDGPWTAAADGVRREEPWSRIVLSMNIPDDQRIKDCAYIAAANPATIRALLARLDAAEADAKRWRKAQSLIAGEHACCGTRFVFNMLKPMGGANIMQGSVSEHFTNAIDAALSSAGGV